MTSLLFLILSGDKVAGVIEEAHPDTWLVSYFRDPHRITSLVIVTDRETHARYDATTNEWRILPFVSQGRRTTGPNEK